MLLPLLRRFKLILEGRVRRIPAVRLLGKSGKKNNWYGLERMHPLVDQLEADEQQRAQQQREQRAAARQQRRQAMARQLEEQE